MRGGTTRHRRALSRVMWVALAAVLALVAIRPVGAFALVGVAMLWPYAKPWIRRHGGYVSLRQLPGVKAPYVVVAFVFVCALPQAARLGELGSPTLWVTVAASGLLGSAAHILNDLRDTAADRADGTASIPVLLGPRAARLLALAAACAGGAIGLSITPLPYLVATGCAAALISCYRTRYDHRFRLWIEIQGVLPLVVALVMNA